VIDRFARFPRALETRTRRDTLAGVPCLLIHPDWLSQAPVMLWLHGRTASKELDPGRYLRWVRSGIAAVALDLPGHGERPGPRLHGPDSTLAVLREAILDIDRVVDALADPKFARAFDLSRTGVGGMSAGGMAALRRLCDGHDFLCAAVEGTTGWLEGLYTPPGGTPPDRHPHDPDEVRSLDPMAHLAGFAPIPLLALHSESDKLVPWAGQRAFIDALRAHYSARGADPTLIEARTWHATGAPHEHLGFGRFSNDAKNLQAEFLVRRLRPTTPAGDFE
jgi:alpha-beta hydrolase superfamily lysophospholipase